MPPSTTHCNTRTDSRTYTPQEEDVPVEMYSTCCQRAADPDDFHASGQARALAEVASLFEMVQKMPDGPQKTHFMKRVSCGMCHAHLTKEVGVA